VDPIRLVTKSDTIETARCNVYRNAYRNVKLRVKYAPRKNEHPEKRGHRERPNTGSILAGTRRTRVCAGY